VEDYGDWERFVERLARDLASALRRRIYGPHMERVRRLGSPSEKLVYLYLVLAQPQSYTTTRRTLDISDDTVARDFQILMGKGFIERDRRFLYWVAELEEEGGEG